MKSLMLLGHHVHIKLLHSVLVLILRVHEALLERSNSILPKDNPSFADGVRESSLIRLGLFSTKESLDQWRAWGIFLLMNLICYSVEVHSAC